MGNPNVPTAGGVKLSRAVTLPPTGMSALASVEEGLTRNLAEQFGVLPQLSGVSFQVLGVTAARLIVPSPWGATMVNAPSLAFVVEWLVSVKPTVVGLPR